MSIQQNPKYKRQLNKKSQVNKNYTLTHIFKNLSNLPNLKTLQYYLEQAWKQGFDPEGARHYQSKVIGSKEWIGAAEVASLLNYFSIEATVVQFINTSHSRSLLGPFVYFYFSQSESTSAPDLLNMAENWTATEIPTAGNEKGSKTRAPLYLQWKGHSVSIIGIDILIPTKGSNGVLLESANISLLVFDPQMKGSDLLHKLKSGKSWKEVFYLPMSKLIEKDCQVVHCSQNLLSGEERFCKRTAIRSLTAK